MAGKEGTTGPKERINIKYTTDTNGVREQIELPLKVLVMGDFTGREDEQAIEDREVVPVDQNLNSIDKAIASQKISLDLSVKDTLSKEGGEMAVHLDIKDMAGFSADSVAESVPMLKKMLELRDALEKLRGPLGNIPEFRKRLNAILGDAKAVEEIVKKLEAQDLPKPRA